MPNTRRRVSYVLPPPTTHVPRLRLPPPGISRLGATAPLLLPAQTAFSHSQEDTHHPYPRHRLGVASLALDTSTLLAGRNAPEGILYTGGRDGMVISWDLGVPMKKRKVKFGALPDSLHRSFGRWEIVTGWTDDVIDEEAEDAADERMGSDGDVLGDVSLAASLKKKRLTRRTSVPFEHEWETDLDAFKPGTVRSCIGRDAFDFSCSHSRLAFVSALRRTQIGSMMFFYAIIIRQVGGALSFVFTLATFCSHFRFFRRDDQILEPPLAYAIRAIDSRLTL
jgi:hypothetical protein